jgi:alkylation response protein AidB-like acyl-CoA dehydrogenase
MSMPFTLDQLLDHARSIVLALQDRQRKADEDRRLALETVEDIRANGILGAMVPRELGGSDLGPAAVFETSMIIARGGASTAWIAGNWAVHGTLGAMFSAEARAELFDSGLPTIATGFSPLRGKTRLVDGGAILTGKWDFCSGIDHSDWVVVQALTDEGMIAHLLPTSDVTILDNWNTIGLRGTGSHDVAVKELFVPKHRLLNMSAVGDGNSEGASVYKTVSLRLPLAQVFGAGIIASLIGSAMAAIDAFTGRTVHTLGGLTGVPRSSRPEVHRVLGKAAADIDAAVAMVRSTYAEATAAIESESGISINDRVRWRRNAAWAGQTAAGALSGIYEVAGARVLFRGDPLEQIYRDGIAASHHHGLTWDRLYVGYGELMLGATETDITMI